MPFIAAVIALVAAGLVGTFVLSTREPSSVGSPGALSPCPGTPNCVNSLSDGEYEAIEPLTYEGDPVDAMHRLRRALGATPRLRIETDTGDYIHAVARTPSYLFADDLEFLLDTERGRIDLRSASRLGVGDHGVNRDRIEGIRAEYERLSR